MRDEKLMTAAEAVHKTAKKHAEGLSWSTVKDSLRTMQRVVSAFVKDKKESLKQFLGNAVDSRALVFRSRRGGPLLETTILNQCLYPALKTLGLPRGGFHAFRRGCNRRWELAGLNPAVQRQQNGTHVRNYDPFIQWRNTARRRNRGMFQGIWEAIGNIGD